MSTTTTRPTAGTWTVDPAASAAGFAVRHLGVATVRGSFAVRGGSLAAGEVDVASVDTGNRIRDARLRDELFRTEEFPTARLAWAGEPDLRPGRRVLRAELTLRGVTRVVSCDVEVTADGEDRLRLRLDATIRQSDFGLEWDALREAGRRLVADRVRLTADIALVRDDA